VKSGWTSAVLLAGPAASPMVVDSQIVDLSDPAVPDSRQPYHAGFGTARAAGSRLSALVASVEQFGGKAVSRLMAGYRAAGYEVRGAGLVVGSLIDPAQIANDHIRIHALEGQLFRGVLERAADLSGVPYAVWRERDLFGVAATVLDRSEQELRSTLTALGRGITGSWRGEQKRATLAAWLVLAGRSTTKPRRHSNGGDA
jgi:hypothetical protein